MTDKTCSVCHITKPIDDFARAGKSTWTGREQRKSSCKTCFNLKQRGTHIRSRRMHFENASPEISPHPKGVQPFAWAGYRGQSPLEGEVNKAVAA